MKKFIISFMFFACMSSCLFAQTAADYFIPLQVGNSLVFRCEETAHWMSRTVYETVENTDSIEGTCYFKVVGSAVLDNELDKTYISHTFWLREDTTGNIMLRAVDLNGSGILDSAMIYPQEGPFFHNGYLQAGYCQVSEYKDTTYHDSITSTSAMVSTGVGTYYNCICRRISRFDSTDSVIWLEYEWYAQNIGKIKNDRITPNPHTDILTQINFQTDVDNTLPKYFQLKQNYPNPFNPLTTIDYQLPMSGHVEIDIYDISGKKVTSLVNMERKAGYHSVIWNAEGLSSGIYIYSLKVDFLVREHRKLCILK